MDKKIRLLKNSLTLFVFLLIVWGFYRLLFQLPEEVEEFVIKPLIWLGGVFYFLRKEKEDLKSIGITFEKIFPAIYYSLALGIVFTVEGLILNSIKYGEISFFAYVGEKPIILMFLISFATAISEEITFRGYLFTRILSVFKKEWIANLSTSVGWALIHIPVALFDWKLSLLSIISYLMLTVIFGIGSAFLFARTKNIFSSILLHFLWEWPVILFR